MVQMTRVRSQIQKMLVVQGMTYADLAAATGLSNGTLRNVACNHDKSRSARVKIEAFFGVPLWSRSEAQQPAGNVAAASVKPACNTTAGGAAAESVSTL
jgi:transcriptional regulator with XRE-family HTH domain